MSSSPPNKFYTPAVNKTLEENIADFGAKLDAQIRKEQEAKPVPKNSSVEKLKTAMEKHEERMKIIKMLQESTQRISAEMLARKRQRLFTIIIDFCPAKINMSERFKYAKNGICRVENFAEHLAAGIFPRIELGRLCGMKWYSELRIYEDDNEIYPVIWCDNYESEVEHRVQIYLKLENHSEDNNENFTKINKEVLNSKEVFIGFYAPILKILNLKKGWLDDGALSFEYGAEMFQFERVEDPNTVGPLCTHKLLSHFHSEELVRFGNHLLIKWKDETWHESIIDLLQLCHGVRLDLTRRKWGLVLNDAHGFKMFNVVSYFDCIFFVSSLDSHCPLTTAFSLSISPLSAISLVFIYHCVTGPCVDHSLLFFTLPSSSFVVVCPLQR
ncbi:unnamed protein product [Caenorhabditis brenneri]